MNLMQARLKELLDYDPESGVFTWKVTRRGKATAGAVAGYICQKGYSHIQINNKAHQAHRLAFLFMNGVFPPETVDHINHIRSDNRWKNLRACSISDNYKNRSINPRNTSGVTGVFWRKSRKKWYAVITANDKDTHLGSFKDFFEACCARKSAEINFCFHENHGKTL